MNALAELMARLIALIWWLNIVVAALAATVFILLGTYYLFSQTFNLNVFYFSLALGLLLGIIWAENVRRKKGLDIFFGAVTGAPYKRDHD